MSFSKVTCFVPACDDCGEDWWENETTEGDAPPHFITKGQALKLLQEVWGWTITRHINGTVTMHCSHCAAKYTDCGRGVHAWREAPVVDWNSPVPDEPVEMCRRCGCVRRDQKPLEVPPAGHPESMTVELGDAAEEYLAELDAELSPEEAI